MSCREVISAFSDEIWVAISSFVFLVCFIHCSNLEDNSSLLCFIWIEKIPSTHAKKILICLLLSYSYNFFVYNSLSCLTWYLKCLKMILAFLSFGGEMNRHPFYCYFSDTWSYRICLLFSVANLGSLSGVNGLKFHYFRTGSLLYCEYCDIKIKFNSLWYQKFYDYYHLIWYTYLFILLTTFISIRKRIWTVRRI